MYSGTSLIQTPFDNLLLYTEYCPLSLSPRMNLMASLQNSNSQLANTRIKRHPKTLKIPLHPQITHHLLLPSPAHQSHPFLLPLSLSPLPHLFFKLPLYPPHLQSHPLPPSLHSPLTHTHFSRGLPLLITN